MHGVQSFLSSFVFLGVIGSLGSIVPLPIDWLVNEPNYEGNDLNYRACDEGGNHNSDLFIRRLLVIVLYGWPMAHNLHNKVYAKSYCPNCSNYQENATQLSISLV